MSAWIPNTGPRDVHVPEGRVSVVGQGITRARTGYSQKGMWQNPKKDICDAESG
jgi:hypothetical protein